MKFDEIFDSFTSAKKIVDKLYPYSEFRFRIEYSRINGMDYVGPLKGWTRIPASQPTIEVRIYFKSNTLKEIMDVLTFCGTNYNRAIINQSNEFSCESLELTHRVIFSYYDLTS